MKLKKISNKAFTLVELLAVIIILTFIAVITIPIILKVLEDAKNGGNLDSFYGYERAIDKFYMLKLSEDSEFELNSNYDILSNGKISDGVNTYNLELSGNMPNSGNLQFENNKLVSGCIKYNDYKVVVKNGTDIKIQEGNC